MRACPACSLAQEHPYPYCKKCGAALDQAPPTAGDGERICSSCGTVQPHSYRFCKKCGVAMSGMSVSEPIRSPRCPRCGGLKEANWRVCEHCGDGAVRPTSASHRLFWAGHAIFTIVWIVGCTVWWYFSYRVAVGPLAAGSTIEIDGKPGATLSAATEEYVTPPISRGFHTLTLRAPGHMWTEFDFRIGWTGLRRRFVLSQIREIACVTVTGPQYTTVTVGARWPDHPGRNEFCAPVGTEAEAEWRPDASQPPMRQTFHYTNDGDVVVVTPRAGSTAIESARGALALGGANNDFTALESQRYVSDFADVIDPAHRQQLKEYCANLERQTEAQLALVVVPSLKSKPVEEVANALFRKWGIGQKSEDIGALLLLSIGDRRTRLEMGQGLEAVITNAGDVLQAMQPSLRAGLLGDALFQAANNIGTQIEHAKGVALHAASMRYFFSTRARGDPELGPFGTRTPDRFAVRTP